MIAWAAVPPSSVIELAVIGEDERNDKTIVSPSCSPSGDDVVATARDGVSEIVHVVPGGALTRFTSWKSNSTPPELSRKTIGRSTPGSEESEDAYVVLK
jgi:hypothetical protein